MIHVRDIVSLVSFFLVVSVMHDIVKISLELLQGIFGQDKTCSWLQVLEETSPLKEYYRGDFSLFLWRFILMLGTWLLRVWPDLWNNFSILRFSDRIICKQKIWTFSFKILYLCCINAYLAFLLLPLAVIIIFEF